MNLPKILAIIPARGGSKSIPRKNIKLLGGKPLISYSIADGLKSKLVDRVIVSTDDPEIVEISKKYGAEVLFIRPSELALDDTPDLPVFIHALKWLNENENYTPGVVVQLRPTSPFRPPGLIDNAIKLLFTNKKADSVRAVIVSGQNPYKMWRINKVRYMTPLLNDPELIEPYNMPRQKLPQTYWQTGHIDVIRYETIMDKNSMSGKMIIPIIIKKDYEVDLDNLDDWEYAEYLINKKHKLET